MPHTHLLVFATGLMIGVGYAASMSGLRRKRLWALDGRDRFVPALVSALVVALVPRSAITAIGDQFNTMADKPRLQNRRSHLQIIID